MKLKHKVLVFNFLAFAILFVLCRYFLHSTITIKPIFISFLSAIIASILSPKFAIAKIEGLEKIVLKWVFIKGFKIL